jgi:chaperonin GroES
MSLSVRMIGPPINVAESGALADAPALVSRPSMCRGEAQRLDARQINACLRAGPTSSAGATTLASAIDDGQGCFTGISGILGLLRAACRPHDNRRSGMTGFRPLLDRVLLKRLETEEKTPGGIIIPDTAKEKPMEGEVLAVGPGQRDPSGRRRPLDIKVGDVVLFGKWSGTDVIIDGQERLLVKEGDILGICDGSVTASIRAA